MIYRPRKRTYKRIKKYRSRGVRSSSARGRAGLDQFLGLVFKSTFAKRGSRTARSPRFKMRSVIRTNPPKALDFPPEYVTDPYKPFPASFSRAKRQRISELREAYAYAMTRRFERKQLRMPDEVAELLFPIMSTLETEVLLVLPLDARSQLIGEPVTISKGDVDGTDAGPRAIMCAVLQAGAVTFILAHNHPTGSSGPSAGDIAVTKRIIAAGKTVDVNLVDHVIIGKGTFTSIRGNNPELWFK